MTQVTGIIAQSFTYGGPAVKSTLDNAKTIADIISSAVTALAIIVGGAWAYFKFVRGRTYRPRIEISLAGQWWQVKGRLLFQARVTVKNVGLSKLGLLQKGTGLRVSVLDSDQPLPPASAKWVSKKVFIIFDQHKWIESGETISDVVLLDLGVSETSPVLLEGRLICHRLLGRNIESNESEIIPADTMINEAEEAGGRNNHNGRRRQWWQGRQWWQWWQGRQGRRR